jgi:cytochrome P450
MMEVMGYFVQLIQQRREQPTGDLLSEAVSWTRDGEPVADSELMSLCLTLFLGGLDTVTQQLGYTFLHLATHPEDRERLIREPDVVPDAVEEFIRTYAIAGPTRKVMRDTEFHGCPLRKGDTVLVAMTASCRDPETTPDPSRIDYDRGPTRHLGFGIGIHRCLGAHLARRELKVALEEWHRLIPEYQLASGVTRDDLHEHFGGVAGFDRLPLAWPT